MKQTRRMISWLVACTLAVVMVANASAKERTGTVARVKGAARYSTGNNVWQPLKVGTILKSGTLVQTAASSYVDVVLGEFEATAPRAIAGGASGAGGAGGGGAYQPKAEQDMVRIQEDTLLAFDKLSVTDTGADEVTDTQLDLRSGRIFGTVKKLTATSRYEIKLPNGVAGVRGTIYKISSDGVVQVLTGSVVISWVAPDGTPMTQTVNGGYQFDARTGLVTPIPDSEHNEMIKIHKESRHQGQGHGIPPKSFIEDHTVYYVSPVQGHNGNPGDGRGDD